MIERLYGILFLVIVLAVLWLVLKFILKITLKLFSCGCIMILVLGMILGLLAYFKVF